MGSYETPKETPRLYQQIEETARETETTMSMPPQIQTGDMNFNFTFHGTDTNSQEEIMKVIKVQMPEIADEIAGTIAVNIQRIFANMKLQTG